MKNTSRKSGKKQPDESASLAALLLEGVEMIRIQVGAAKTPDYIAWQKKVMRKQKLLS